MANVEWSFIDQESPLPLSRGDLVSAEAGGLPVYEVVSVSEGRAWLREAQTQRDFVMPAHSLRWRMERPVGPT